MSAGPAGSGAISPPPDPRNLSPNGTWGVAPPAGEFIAHTRLQWALALLVVALIVALVILAG